MEHEGKTLTKPSRFFCKTNNVWNIVFNIHNPSSAARIARKFKIRWAHSG